MDMAPNLMAQWITWVTPSTSMPRAAISVATRTRIAFDLKPSARVAVPLAICCREWRRLTPPAPTVWRPGSRDLMRVKTSRRGTLVGCGKSAGAPLLRCGYVDDALLHLVRDGLGCYVDADQFVEMSSASRATSLGMVEKRRLPSSGWCERLADISDEPCRHSVRFVQY